MKNVKLKIQKYMQKYSEVKHARAVGANKISGMLRTNAMHLHHWKKHPKALITIIKILPKNQFSD